MKLLFYKKIVALCLMMLAIQPWGKAQQQMRFSAGEVKQDLDYLYKILEKSHYDLYAYVPKEKMDALYTKMHQSVGTDSLSYVEVHKLLAEFTAAANVGHTELQFPVQAYISYLKEGGKLFPLDLSFENGKALIRHNLTDNEKLTKGTEVMSVEGMPIEEVKAKLLVYLSAERPYYKEVKLEQITFPRMYWMVFGAKEKFLIQVKNTKGKTEDVSLKAIPVMDLERGRIEILSSGRQFKYFDDIAYLKPGAFAPTDENDSEEQFKHFIDSAFSDIQNKGVEKLIVDLRNHPGGHDAYSNHLIAYFADKPFKWYSKFQVRTSALLKEFTHKNATGETSDFQKAIYEHRDGEIFPYDFPAQDPVAERKRFKGKVYVMVNRHSYSMSAVSAALIQDYGFATLVGEETGDIPTLYASQYSFTLPNTGREVLLSKSYIVRPNGDETVKGVVPDIQVRDHLVDEKDEILEYTLEKLLDNKI